jgi:diadenosine tetraphosphate (Ap4A) HIT family hydrolase
MCRDLGKPDAFLGGRLVIAQNAAGMLVLSPNQGIPGYCVLYARRHVTEPYLLEEGARREWLELWMSGARAIGRVYAPDKLNYQVLGNVVPHLHAHLIPRYYGDRAPAAPISPDADPRMLGEHEIDERVRALRDALHP